MAAHFDLNINQGSTFHVRLQAKTSAGANIDLTSWDLRALAKLRFSDTVQLIDLNPQKVSGTSGYIDITITATQTAALPIIEGVYDLEMYDASGYVKKLVGGYVRIYPEVTC